MPAAGSTRCSRPRPARPGPCGSSTSSRAWSSGRCRSPSCATTTRQASPRRRRCGPAAASRCAPRSPAAGTASPARCSKPRYLVFIGPKQTKAGQGDAQGPAPALRLQGSLVPSLRRRPRGLLEVLDEHGIVMAIAENLVSVSSPDGGPFLVKSVEHGVGYSWHGRQDRTYRGDLELVVDRLGGISVVKALPLESYVPASSLGDLARPARGAQGPVGHRARRVLAKMGPGT